MHKKQFACVALGHKKPLRKLLSGHHPSSVTVAGFVLIVVHNKLSMYLNKSSLICCFPLSIASIAFQQV